MPLVGVRVERRRGLRASARSKQNFWFWFSTSLARHFFRFNEARWENVFFFCYLWVEIRQIRTMNYMSPKTYFNQNKFCVVYPSSLWTNFFFPEDKELSHYIRDILSILSVFNNFFDMEIEMFLKTFLLGPLVARSKKNFRWLVESIISSARKNSHSLDGILGNSIEARGTIFETSGVSSCFLCYSFLFFKNKKFVDRKFFSGNFS